MTAWIFLYLGIGLIILAIRGYRNGVINEVLDYLACIAGWPFTLVYYPVYRYKRWRRTVARQASISK